MYVCEVGERQVEVEKSCCECFVSTLNGVKNYMIFFKAVVVSVQHEAGRKVTLSPCMGSCERPKTLFY